MEVVEFALQAGPLLLPRIPCGQQAGTAAYELDDMVHVWEGIVKDREIRLDLRILDVFADAFEPQIVEELRQRLEGLETLHELMQFVSIHHQLTPACPEWPDLTVLPPSLKTPSGEGYGFGADLPVFLSCYKLPRDRLSNNRASFEQTS